MFIDTPQHALLLATREDGITGDGTHYLLRMRRDASTFLYENRDAKPSQEDYAKVAEHLTWQTEINISPDQAEAILSLYPQARIKVAKYGTGDTDVCDDLSFAISHFFLACDWPTFGDKVDIKAFLALLKKQAGLMGFTCVEKVGQ